MILCKIKINEHYKTGVKYYMKSVSVHLKIFYIGFNQFCVIDLLYCKYTTAGKQSVKILKDQESIEIQIRKLYVLLLAELTTQFKLCLNNSL